MKRLFSLCLAGAVTMGMAGTVYAEDLPYFRTYNDGGVYMGNSITPETYPQPCLTSSYLSSILSGYAEPLYLTFDAPENALPIEFSEMSCTYLDTTQQIQYDYYLEESDAYETFLNECSSEEYILFDGSEGYAAYVDPGDSYYARGYALIGMEDFGKSAKLYVRVSFSVSPGDSEASRTALLTEALSEEITRITESQSTELLETPSWTTNRFAGFKIPSTDISNQMVVVTFPENDGTYDVILESCDDDDFEGLFYYPEENKSIEFEFETDSRSPMAIYYQEKEPENCFTVTLQGYDVDVYLNTTSEYSTYFYASIFTGADQDDENYFSMKFNDQRASHWTNQEEAMAFLEEFLAGVSLTEADADPYVPGQAAETTEEEADNE